MKINNLFSLNNLNNCWYSEKRYHTKTKDDQVMRGFHWLKVNHEILIIQTNFIISSFCISLYILREVSLRKR